MIPEVFREGVRGRAFLKKGSPPYPLSKNFRNHPKAIRAYFL
jgi:hypothetical protein